MSDRNDAQAAISDENDPKKSLDQMKIFMELRGLQPNTVYTFALCARRFLAHAGKAPVAIKAADVESFLLDLTHKGRSPQTRNVNLSAVRCLLFATLGSDGRVITAGIPNARLRRSSQEILTGTEVERLLAATDSPKYYAIFILAYGAGLRVGEITALQAEDIDSKRMLIHVREGKTGPRDVMLSPRVLLALRTHWKASGLTGPALFPGGRSQRPGTQLTRESIGRVLAKVARKAGIPKRVHPHTLRHCFATHMLESGADIRKVQVLLGHASIGSTTKYLHLSSSHLHGTPSPIDLLGTPAGKILG
jgi:site-specific recombinase XerD